MAMVPNAADRGRGEMLVEGALNRGGGGGTPAYFPPSPSAPAPGPVVAPPPAAAVPAPAGPAIRNPTVPSVIPDYGNPFEGFDPSQLAATFSREGSAGEGTWSPQGMDYSGDAEFEALLKKRMAGEGVGPSWEDIVSGSYDPYARIIDRQTEYAQDQSIEGMISRGMLDSGEARGAYTEIGLDALDRKNAYLGQLGMQHEQLKQEGINTALSQFGIIEGNKLQAKTTITSANIGAAAQVKSAAIQAGATREAALVSAQARLQEAGLNAKVAMTNLQKQMDMDLVSAGFDPYLFQNDEAYRGDVIAWYEMLREEQRHLQNMVADGMEQDIYGSPRPQ